jgi:Rrf2 family protein
MFSKATEYGLRATIYIAQKSTVEKKPGLKEIAKAIGSPQAFTAKILQELTRNKIIGSTPGPNGGFYISANAKKLAIRSVLYALGEDEILDKCVIGLAQCSEKRPCPMHSKYKMIKAKLIEMFEAMTIQQLSDELNSGKIVIGDKRNRARTPDHGRQ